jgi:arginase family enzyme
MRDRSHSFIVLLLLTGLAASGHLVACDVVGADSTDEPRRTVTATASAAMGSLMATRTARRTISAAPPASGSALATAS